MDENKIVARSSETGKIPILPMIAIMLGVFMGILDTSIVNVAVPKMMAVFGSSESRIQWVLTGYMLTMGILVPVSGWLVDRFGGKHVFMFSVSLFTFGSLLCGIAWSDTSMIFFRIIQAVGAGMMMPTSMSLMFKMVPESKRGAAMGVWGIAIMFAPAIGPTLSGYITEYMNWRLIFYINIPIGILDIILVSLFLHEFDHKVSKRFDKIGFALSSIGFFSLLYGLSEAPDKGWSSTEIIVYLAVAAITLVSFVVYELNAKEPMIELRLFKDYTFSLTTGISALVNIALFAGIFLLPVFLQNILGFSALQTGILMFPSALASGVMMAVSGILYDRIGAKPLVIIGLLVTILMTFLMHNISLDTSYSTIMMWYTFRGFGIGMCMAPLTTAGMSSIGKNLINNATAISNTARQVAASFGTAILTTLLATRNTFHYAMFRESVTSFDNSASNLQQIQSNLTIHGMNAIQAKQAAIMSVYGLMRKQAFISAIDDVFLVTVFIAIGAWVLALFLKRFKKGDSPKVVIMD